jgi:hypothetical protein
VRLGGQPCWARASKTRSHASRTSSGRVPSPLTLDVDQVAEAWVQAPVWVLLGGACSF